MYLNDEFPLVIFLTEKAQYAVSSEHVSTMVAVPETRPVPHSPRYVRGIINLRGKVLPLIDLRVRLGYTSSLDEHRDFLTMMAQREQDHRNWLNELESSVEEEREFTLATDPHKCAFGKWYDTFQSDDNALMAFIRKFDRPHRKIHALAHKVEALIAEGRVVEANALIADTRSQDLQRMVKLFSSVGDVLRESHREIAMIIETPQFDYGVAIDQIKAVEFLKQGTIEELPRGLEMQVTNNLVTLIGRRQRDDSTVQILDPLRICDPEDVKGMVLDDGQAEGLAAVEELQTI